MNAKPTIASPVDQEQDFSHLYQQPPSLWFTVSILVQELTLIPVLGHSDTTGVIVGASPDPQNSIHSEIFSVCLMPRVLLVTSVGIHRNKDRPAKFCSLKAKIRYLLGASGALVSGGISMGYAPSNIGVLLVLRSFVPSCLVSRTHTLLAYLHLRVHLPPPRLVFPARVFTCTISCSVEPFQPLQRHSVVPILVNRQTTLSAHFRFTPCSHSTHARDTPVYTR